MRSLIIVLSVLVAACQREVPEICKTNAPYDDSKYDQWLAESKKAGCDKKS
jgi:hypothetical protein